MSGHVFHEIYLHVNWHVKDDRPTLRDDLIADQKEHHARNRVQDRLERTTSDEGDV